MKPINEQVSSPTRPHPREAFGHPVTIRSKIPFCDERPGFLDADEPPQAEYADSADQHNAILPPRNEGPIPKTSLSERIRIKLAEEEVKQ